MPSASCQPFHYSVLTLPSGCHQRSPLVLSPRCERPLGLSNMNYCYRSSNQTKEQGAVGVLLALYLAILVSLLAVVDVGFMFITKRELQKAADLAALAGVRQLVMPDGTRSCAAATTAGTENAQTNLTQPALPPFSTMTVEISCGKWDTAAADGPFVADTGDSHDTNAVKATIRSRPYSFFLSLISNQEPGEIQAEAVSAIQAPQAQLKIRSTLASLEDGPVNRLLGALLGGEISLDVVGWQGVANADVNLLQFMNNMNNMLGLDVAASIGTYHGLLDTQLELGQILDAMINAVEPSATAGLAIDVLKEFQKELQEATDDTYAISHLPIRLGDLLNLQAGAESAGLNALINAFYLVRAVAEVANYNSSVAATLPICLNLTSSCNATSASISTQVKVTEPAQLSVIGNPALAALDPLGPNAIFVRTAQVRTLTSVNLEQLGVVSALLSVVNGLVGALVGVEVLGGSHLDLVIDAGSGNTYLTDYECSADGGKMLEAAARTSVSALALGEVSHAFSSNHAIEVRPVPLLKLKPLFGLLGSVTLGIVLNDAPNGSLVGGTVPVLGSDAINEPLTFEEQRGTSPQSSSLPNVEWPDNENMYQSFQATDLVQSLSSTLRGIKLVEIERTGLIGGLISAVNILLGSVLSIVGVLVSALGMLVLDPLVNGLLQLLGLDIANIEVGAKLTCDAAGILVD
jgi:Predicted membrane protein